MRRILLTAGHLSIGFFLSQSAFGKRAELFEWTGDFLIKVTATTEPEEKAAAVGTARSTANRRGWQWHELGSPANPTIRLSAVRSIAPAKSAWIVARPESVEELQSERAIHSRMQTQDRKHNIEASSIGFAWDKAHENLGRPDLKSPLRSALSSEGFKINSIEPNISIKQKIPEEQLAPKGTSQDTRKTGRDAVIFAKRLHGWPTKGKYDWHLDATGLREARQHVLSMPDTEKSVRVALLDTGYDPNHITLPKHFNRELSTRFLADGTRDDSEKGASEKSNHGTGTMAILAGNQIIVDDGAPDYLGAAPTTEVFEIAIAHDVILFAVASLAAGLSEAVADGADVVSISMGGIPSNAWADSVNDAYEHGTVVVAASGNCIALPILGFIRSPTRTVYPAAFSRVISVPGITASNRSYRWLPLPGGLWPFYWKDVLMRGNIGPRRDMVEAVAAYTPNMPWAIWEAPDGNDHRMIRLSGSGTSCATPQVAAAAALWLQAKRSEIEKMYGWRTWQKAECVFHAFRKSSDLSNDHTHQSDDGPIGKQFGMGILKADNALEVNVQRHPHVRKPAVGGLRWLDLLFPPFEGGTKSETRSPIGEIHQEMYQLEAAQLLAMSPKLQKVMGDADFDEETGPPKQTEDKFIRELLSEPAASNSLKKAIHYTIRNRRH